MPTFFLMITYRKLICVATPSLHEKLPPNETTPIPRCPMFAIRDSGKCRSVWRFYLLHGNCNGSDHLGLHGNWWRNYDSKFNRWSFSDQHRAPSVLRQDGPNQRDDPCRGDEHRGLCVPKLHRADKRDYPEQRDQHRQWCVLCLHRSDKRDYPEQRDHHREPSVLILHRSDKCDDP